MTYSPTPTISQRDRQLLGESDLALNPATLIALATAREEGRQEERERCANIADESARLGDQDGNPDVVAAARIIARKIRMGVQPC